MKWGVWSLITKRFLFGISENSKREAKWKLIEKIGYYEAQKSRFCFKLLSTELEKAQEFERIEKKCHRGRDRCIS